MTSEKPNDQKETQQSAPTIWENVQQWFSDLWRLEVGADRWGTITTIRDNKRMRGANAWLLICSIMIASLGLDLNSPAVIIGAMLISPLMNPILGVGLSVAINDRETLYISLQHFGISVIIALITSIVYFKITPLGLPTDEILGRTKPTLLDGLVAVVGGLAGIISTSRKEKSNAIPGVAIATALMPPLCVSGFGIANGDSGIALNAFYLFFLNSFFIALTTYIICRLLRFPYKEYVNQTELKRTRFILTIFSLILIIPSGFILYNLWEELQEKHIIERFKEKHFGIESSTYCIKYDIKTNGDSERLLVMEMLGKSISSDSINFYKQSLKDLGIDDMKLVLLQDEDVGIDQLSRMEAELSSFKQVANQLEKVEKQQSEKEILIEELRHTLDSLKRDTIPFQKLCLEAKTIFPDIERIGFAKMQSTDFKSKQQNIPLLLLDWDRKKSYSTRKRDESKIYEFMKLRAELDTLTIVNF